jgi:IclR family acetate operon transcriptional repressor
MYRRSPYIELIGKTFTVLEALRDGDEALTLHDLTVRTGLVKSSIHRILHSLKRHGYVEQEGTGGPYRLGVRFLALARGFAGGMQLIRLARPYLRELRDRFDETTYLAIPEGDRCAFVDRQDTHRDLRLIGPLGAAVHYHATAAGKAIAAFLPAPVRAELLQGLRLVRVTRRTLTERSQVEGEWAKIHRLGYAVNNEETIVGAVFIAAPFFDAASAVSGSITIGIPKARVSERLRRDIAGHLIDTCRRLSETLRSVGYESPRWSPLSHAHGQDAHARLTAAQSVG